MKIIITDLTRFGTTEKVCTAGVTQDGVVIRPIPYLLSERCRELDIHPGGILQGNFQSKENKAPHTEDSSYSDLKFLGACSGSEFQQALDSTLFGSIEDGFEFRPSDGNKCIPMTDPPPRSLITIRVNPTQLRIVRDTRYDTQKLKAHLVDAAGVSLPYVSITDRGFFDFARNHVEGDGDVDDINRFVHSQEFVYLRLGLSREHKVKDRNGYWIQLNGIYTFPHFLDYIRCYN